VLKGTFLEKLQGLVISEVAHRVNQLLELGILPLILQKIFFWSRVAMSEKFQGDITIVPPLTASDFVSFLSNPKEVQLKDKISISERSTWESPFLHLRSDKQTR